MRAGERPAHFERLSSSAPARDRQSRSGAEAVLAAVLQSGGLKEEHDMQAAVGERLLNGEIKQLCLGGISRQRAIAVK